MTQIDIPEIVKVWKLGGDTGNVRSNNKYQNNAGYNLFCTTNNKYLTWKKVPIGINLDFISNAGEKKVHFRLPDGKEREIVSGELLALGIGGGEAFLRYARRDLGINLKWSASPIFEWKIYSGNGEVGKPISFGDPLALVNMKVEPSADFCIFFDRPPGMADVGWTTSPEFWNKVANVAIKTAIEAARKKIGL